MGGYRLAYPACVYAGKLEIDSQDVIFLRKHAFPDGLTGNDDVLALIEIHRAPSVKCTEWNNFFVEAMTGFIVNHAWPQGSLDEVNARWIISVVAPDGMVADPVELEFLVHAIEMARSVPDFLSALAMDQVRLALSAGKGAYAGLRQSKRHGVAGEDVDFLMRILRGACNKGELVLTSREAKVLAAIEKKVANHLNHPDWLNMLLVIRDKGVEKTRSGQPWLKLMPDRDEDDNKVA